MPAHDPFMGLFRRTTGFPGFLAGFLAIFLINATCARADQEGGVRLTGSRGLNTVPDARMDPSGTLRLTTSLSEPYLHAAVSAQLAAPLSFTLRQSAWMSGLLDSPKSLSPALDFKLRLLEETAWRPAFAVGMDSAFGAQEMASEYLVFSKRYDDFDLSAGIGWGRLGRGGSLANPLGAFSRDRNSEGGESNGPGDWFTGKEVGCFAGINYTPSFAPALSFRLDWSEDRWTFEKEQDSSFDPPAPWSASLNWHPLRWLDLGIGTAGGRTLMARMSLSAMPDLWPVLPYQKTALPSVARRQGEEETDKNAIVAAAAREGIALRSLLRSPDGRTLSVVMDSDPAEPLPQRIGRTARFMAAYSGPKIESFLLMPENDGLKGLSVRLSRHDLERVDGKSISPEEIWDNVVLDVPPRKRPEGWRRLKSQKPAEPVSYKKRFFSLGLQSDISLQERDAGIVHRTAFRMDLRPVEVGNAVRVGARMRVNLFGNASDLPLRENSSGFSRGAFGAFSGLRVMPENLFLNSSRTVGNGIYASVTTGYVEEMFAGMGGEILWRPFGKRLALGAEIWDVSLREPSTPGALGLSLPSVVTGHIGAWYEWPENGVTFYAKAGRYLGTDWGGTFGIERVFGNGVRLDASATLTNGVDRDEFGRRDPSGLAFLTLHVPIGNLPSRFIPQGSEVQLNVGSLGRNAGQRIANPLPLYERTNDFSTGRLGQNWPSVVE